MALDLEAYTAEGVLTGTVAVTGRLLDVLAADAPIAVHGGAVAPFDVPADRAPALPTVAPDDLFAVVAPPDTVTPVHAAWHGVVLDVGPYRVSGDLPSLPGFDPARALARPTGSFVLLGRARVQLRGGGLGSAIRVHPFVWVNRYAVDAVSSDLELGFFFPGASGTAGFATQSAIA